MKRSYCLTFAMLLLVVALLMGCKAKESTYENLSDEDKIIVDVVCNNADKFENSESDMQAIRFADWNGNIYFIVQDMKYLDRTKTYSQTAEKWYIIDDEELVETNENNYLLSSWPGTVQCWSSDSPKEACAKALKSCIKLTDK